MSITINEQIAALRKARGVSQTELGAALGVSSQAVSKWEKGISCPDIALLPSIAAYFDVTVDDLLGYKSGD